MSRLEPLPSPVLPLFRTRSEPPLQMNEPKTRHTATRLEHPYSSVIPQSRQISGFSASPLSYEQEKIPADDRTGQSWEPAVSSRTDIVRPIHPLSYSGAGRFWKPPDARSGKNNFREWVKRPLRFGSKKASQSKPPPLPIQRSVREAENVGQANPFAPQVESGGLGSPYLHDRIDNFIQRNLDEQRNRERRLQRDGDERLSQVQTIIGEPASVGPDFLQGSLYDNPSLLPRGLRLPMKEDPPSGPEKHVQGADLSVSWNHWDCRWEPKNLCFIKHDHSMFSFEEPPPCSRPVFRDRRLAPSRAFSDPPIPMLNKVSEKAWSPASKSFRSFSDAGVRSTQSWYDHEDDRGDGPEHPGDPGAFTMLDGLVETPQSQSAGYPHSLWQQRQPAITVHHNSTLEDDYVEEPSGSTLVSVNSAGISPRDEGYQDGWRTQWFGLHDPANSPELCSPEFEEERDYWKDAAGLESDFRAGGVDFEARKTTR